ncbi:MAG: NUDIX hydrolase [Actinomycetia bacterium]|nr:NUDIX hydrolase [Actinomycetes bacterium]
MRDFAVQKNSRLIERLARWQRGEIVPTEPALAATVMLVRDAEADGADRVEVFVQRRVAYMDFAPSMLVFPGGGVDPRDAREDVTWAGRSPQGWAEVLGTTTDTARLLVTAAIRELFEEAGVLLAGPDEESVVADVRSPIWHERRVALTQHAISLADILAEEDLVLRSDLLAYRAHWTTPEFEPRRYDTRFFAATLPVGQRPDGSTSEADYAAWAGPAATLARGDVMMLPPTRVMLEILAEAGGVADVVVDAADVGEVMPVLTVLPDSSLVMRTLLPDRSAP